LKNNRDFCSKPPKDENNLPKKNFSITGKSFTSRLKKRSLDPATRISAMMPLKSDISPEVS